MKGGKVDTKESATRVIEMMAAAEPSPISSQQVAVLVSGSVLMCSWQYISQGLQHFDSRGVRCLMEAWVVMAASFGLGQLAKIIARSAGLDERVRQYQAAQDDLNSPCSRNSSSSSDRSSCHQQVVQDLLHNAGEKEGFEVAAAAEHQQDDDDEDDVGVQKRIAQAQAAAKLAEYQNHIRHLLSSINSSNDISSSTNMLLQLTEQLFESPMNVCEFVNQGGVAVILTAARSALRTLESSSGQAEVLPALLQVSWVLPQVAHGPPACCAALTNQDVAATLLEVTKAVVAAAPAQQQEAKEPVLRNLCWIILLLCDAHNSASRGLASSSLQVAAGGTGAAAGDVDDALTAAVACASALCDAGVADVLQQLVSLQFGVSAGWIAAATLGLFTQLGQQQQHQGLRVTAAQGMLVPDSLHGLGYLLHHQPQICDRLQGLVYYQVQYLLTHHTREVLQLLVEEHLVGTFATGLPPNLARLLVCQLLSSQGQEVLSIVEESYELDVPLALAQIIPLPIHIKLPPAPCSVRQQQQRAEIQPAVDGDRGAVDQPPAAAAAVAAPEVAAAAEDVYTDILASRLLLQRERLGELLTVFAEDLLEKQQQREQQGLSEQQQDEYAAAAAAAMATDQDTGQQQLTPVCDAVLRLTRHLMSRDLELQAVQHVRGDSIDSEQTISSSDSAAASSSTGSRAGSHHADMAGLLPAGQLLSVGAAVEAAQSDQQELNQQLLTLPPLPAAAAAAASVTRSSSSSGRSTVFKFGDCLEHTVSSATYKQICSSSKMINSILSRDGKRPARPVTVLKTPSFSPMANMWILQCLERWVVSSDLSGFNARQAAKLWVAADFWQVDGLQMACEDVIIAAAAAAAAGGRPAEASAADSASYLHLAFEVCAQYPASSSRLRRLAVQVLLRRFSDAYGANAQHAATAVALLRQLLGEYKGVVMPSLLAELRDRLVTMCMLNVGLDADTPHDMVE